MSDSEDKLDETLDETFPASDAPANTVETGIRIVTAAIDEREVVARDNVDAQRFEISIDEQLAFLQYERKGDAMVFIHTRFRRHCEDGGG